MVLKKVVEGLNKKGGEWAFSFENGQLVFTKLSLDSTTYMRAAVDGIMCDGDGVVNTKKLLLALKRAKKPSLSIEKNSGLLVVKTNKRTTKIPLREYYKEKTIDFQRLREGIKGSVIVESEELKEELQDIIAFSGEKKSVGVTLEGAEGKLLLKYEGSLGDDMTTSVANKGLMVQEVTVDAFLLRELLVFKGVVSLWFKKDNPLVLKYERKGFVFESALAPRTKKV